MECNRDDALRAKEIAEQKFSARDVEGAKKFALKAQNLFPELEGITQMISTLDVYLSAEVRINGENDWYSILCVNALADEDTVKKQYRKLALQLHPDKNKSIGAEGAFKLISEAWSILSDKSRKAAYDQKRTGKQQKASRGKKDHSASKTANANGFYNFANNTSSDAKMHKSSTGGASCTVQQKLDTFWTSCNRCRMQYEYLRIYLKHNLLCPNCHEAFYAVETGAPSNGASGSFNFSAPQQSRVKTKQKPNHHSSVKGDTSGFSFGGTAESYNSTNFQWCSFSEKSEVAGAAPSSSAATQAANLVHQTFERVKREREEAEAAAKRDEALLRKSHSTKRPPSSTANSDAFTNVETHEKRRRHCINDVLGVPNMKNEANHTIQGTEVPDISAFVVEKANNTYVDSIKARVRLNNIIRDFSQCNIRNLLIERSTMEIQKKLQEWNSVSAVNLPSHVKGKHISKQVENGRKLATATSDGVANDGNKLDYPMGKGRKVNGRKSSPHNSDSDKEAVERTAIDVPDPDFFDFDMHRSERSFGSDQVWATYDNEDGMPRFYVLIQKVLSYKPFKIQMSFLNSKSNSELGPLRWVASGFVKTCGDFRVGKYEIGNTPNIFSHKVTWGKGPRGVIRVVPRKGDTWALYKNWSPEWNEHTPEDLIYKYDMVEVVDDYNDEQGVAVTPLVKVAGFKTVFHRHLDPNEVRRIPREEMFRFSHQVPSHLLTGQEAHTAPKGCRELDPAATPVELLKVMTEVTDTKASKAQRIG